MKWSACGLTDSTGSDLSPKTLLTGMVRHAECTCTYWKGSDRVAEPSMLSFYTAFKSESWWQQAGVIIPNVFLLSYVKLFLGDPGVLKPDRICNLSLTVWVCTRVCTQLNIWETPSLRDIQIRCLTHLNWLLSKWMSNSYSLSSFGISQFLALDIWHMVTYLWSYSFRLSSWPLGMWGSKRRESSNLRASLLKSTCQSHT